MEFPSLGVLGAAKYKSNKTQTGQTLMWQNADVTKCKCIKIQKCDKMQFDMIENKMGLSCAKLRQVSVLDLIISWHWKICSKLKTYSKKYVPNILAVQLNTKSKVNNVFRNRNKIFCRFRLNLLLVRLEFWFTASK